MTEGSDAGRLDERRQRVLDSITEARGQKPSATWDWLSGLDIEFMEVYAAFSNGLWSPTGPRVLEPKTRELVAIVVLSQRGFHWSIKTHLRRALRLGATPREILEFLEAAVIPGGSPTLMLGATLLKEVLEEDGLEGGGEPR